MDYDTFGTALDSVLILAAALLCGLHLWFSAAMASVQKLGGQMSTLAEEHPPMQYYLKQKNRLRITAVAEVISFTALLTLAAYLLIFAKGWAHHWNIWLTLLLPAGVSLTAALLLDGCAPLFAEYRHRTACEIPRCRLNIPVNVGTAGYRDSGVLAGVLHLGFVLPVAQEVPVQNGFPFAESVDLLGCYGHVNGRFRTAYQFRVSHHATSFRSGSKALSDRDSGTPPVAGKCH